MYLSPYMYNIYVIYISNAQAPYPPPCLVSLCPRGLAFPRHYLWVSWACLGNLGIMPRPHGRSWAIWALSLGLLSLGLLGVPGQSMVQPCQFWSQKSSILESKIVVWSSLGHLWGRLEPRTGFFRFRVPFPRPGGIPFWPPFWHDFQTLAEKSDKKYDVLWILRGS